MSFISRKFILLIVVVLGMISFSLISDRINYHHNMSQLIDSPINHSLIINSNIYRNENSIKSQTNYHNLSIIAINGSFNTSNVTLLENISSEEEADREEGLYFLQKYNLVHDIVLQYESKVFVPIKRPNNSKLIYADQVKDITVMTIGDHKCDNNYGKDLTVVVFVICRVDGFKRRSIIRETWGQHIQQSKNSKLYFTIGLTKDESIQKKVELENAEFGDILQWNFIDNYYNLTIKSLGILRWITLNCFNTQFIYKVDDDCILNHQNLLKFCDTASERTIYGHLWKKAHVDRQIKSKFFISKSDFKNKSYPDYTGGPWLMSGSIVPIIYETAITKSLPALPYEDVYITGVVASKSGINRKQLHGLVYFDKSLYKNLNYCWFKESVIFWQNLDDLMMKNGWKKIMSSNHLNCITTTVKPLNSFYV